MSDSDWTTCHACKHTWLGSYACPWCTLESERAARGHDVALAVELRAENAALKAELAEARAKGRQ
jgi:hypothetical protein